ncbi:MAG TPA: cardiolipin synthase [Victivallales bacterium]|nr:cardiolipin synthase [Victivallales bacterium]
MEFFIDILICLYYLYIVASAIFLIFDNRKPSSTFAWLFVFVTIPVLGILFYIVFGKNHRIIGRKRKKIDKNILDKFSEILNHSVTNHKNIKSKIVKEDTLFYKSKLINLLESNSFSLLTSNNNVKVIQDGQEKFTLLKADLENSKSFIHMAYYIWRDDELTHQIKDILIRKAKAGINIRILVDALGSISLSKKYKRELRDAGVEIYRYFDFNSIFTLHTINHRNHRKIVVIDCLTGYAGGMNMGKEYISGDFGYDNWRDTHVRIVGNGVKTLQAVFTLEWENTTHEKLYVKKYFPEVEKNTGTVAMQTTVSGPDSKWDAVKQMYFTMICSAKKNIFIQTPYFVPDEGLLDSLKTVSLSGVDVKIMITGIPDNKVPYWAAFTYFKELIEAGIKIYHYNKCFLHSKVIVIDSEICSIGTANFDIRSFTINYELMMIFYNKKISMRIEKDFNDDLKDCSKMTAEKYEMISTLSKFRNSVARLMSPLL